MTKGTKYLKAGIENAMRALKPKPVMKVWEWVDKHCAAHWLANTLGLMDTGRTPPMRGLFDLYWNPRVHFFHPVQIRARRWHAVRHLLRVTQDRHMAGANLVG